MAGLLSDPMAFAAAWYRWGVAIGFAITLVVSLWVFYDSQRQRASARGLRVLALLAVMVVVPGAVLSLFPDLGRGLGDLPLLLAYLGLLASLLALIVLVLYSLGVGVTVWVEGEELEDEPLPPEQPIVPVAVQIPPAQTLRAPSPARATPQNLAAPTIQPPPAPDPGPAAVEVTQVLPTLQPANDPLAWLVVMNGPWAGKEFRLQAITHIGRDASRNEISLDDKTISRQHARVRLEKEGFVIYDLASANGTVVNGDHIERQTLRPGDRVVIGQAEFAFMYVDESEEPPTPHPAPLAA